MISYFRGWVGCGELPGLALNFSLPLRPSSWDHKHVPLSPASLLGFNNFSYLTPRMSIFYITSTRLLPNIYPSRNGKSVSSGTEAVS